MATSNTKQSVRSEVRKRIKAMTEAERLSQSLFVCREIVASAEWASACCVMLYEAMPDEVNLSTLFDIAEREGKTVYCPEPSADAAVFSLEILQAVDLVIVPGRAFTLAGERMGRGGGYYDRLLAKTNSPIFGVAFDCQIFETIPTDPWDKPLDRIFCKINCTKN